MYLVSTPVPSDFVNSELYDSPKLGSSAILRIIISFGCFSFMWSFGAFIFSCKVDERWGYLSNFPHARADIVGLSGYAYFSGIFVSANMYLLTSIKNQVGK